jgi:formimidoylglutamase
MRDQLAAYCVPIEAAEYRRTEPDDRRFDDFLIPFDRWEGSAPMLALLGVPQDEGVRRNGGRIGAAEAPPAIRQALGKLAASIGSRSLPDNVRVLDCGVLAVENMSLEDVHRRQEHVVGLLLDSGASVVVLGGGHDTALPDGRAIGKRATRLGIVNVDAHLDVRPPAIEGSHSGSPFRELIEDPACRLGMLIEFGTQPFSASAHHVRYVLERGHAVWMLDDIRRDTLDVALDRVVDALGACDAVHLSLDMDALASAYAPGVSAPASDGFRPDEVARVVERIAALPTCRLVDIVEVNPRYDADGRTVRLAAYFAAVALWTFAHRT